MVYLDTSVALAELLAEDRRAHPGLWQQALVASRLLEYELWNRIHARGHAETHGAMVRELLARVSFLELSPAVLSRALEPYPSPVRTLDALHLATLEFLRASRVAVKLASFDDRMRAAARSLGIPLFRL